MEKEKEKQGDVQKKSLPSLSAPRGSRNGHTLKPNSVSSKAESLPLTLTLKKHHQEPGHGFKERSHHSILVALPCNLQNILQAHCPQSWSLKEQDPFCSQQPLPPASCSVPPRITHCGPSCLPETSSDLLLVPTFPHSFLPASLTREARPPHV